MREEKNKHKFKKCKIMLIGKIRKIKKPNISFILFTMSIILFSLSLMATAFQRLPIYDVFNNSMDLPYVLELRGNVISKEETIINIGGYSCKVESSDTFEMEFVAESKDKILVCITDSKGYLLYNTFVSYDANEWSKEITVDLKKGSH